MKYEFKVELKKTNKKNISTEQSQKIGKLKKTLILAHQIKKYMDDNNISTLLEMSKLTKTSVARLCQILQLQRLSPNIQEEILFSNDYKLRKLSEKKMRKTASLIYWDQQITYYREMPQNIVNRNID
ncbi:MAG: hypothetical protein WCQ47_09040 [bacterium]